MTAQPCNRLPAVFAPRWKKKAGTPVTISVGACYCLPGEDMDTILRHTDKALYKAKNQDRNRVCIQTENGPEIHPV